MRLRGRARSLTGYKVHASAPFEAPRREDEILWVDLDLDFEVTADHVEIDDEAEFHEHARTMGYPDEVVRGAWSGISTIAARYTNGDWPFDGSLQDLVDTRPALGGEPGPFRRSGASGPAADR